MEDLKKQLKEMIIEELHLEGVSPKDIEDGAALFGEGLGLDSLDALQLAVALEERFGVKVGDEEAGKVAFASVNALAGFVEQHREATAAAG